MALFYSKIIFLYIAVILNLCFNNELFLTLFPLVLSVFVFKNVSKDEVKIFFFPYIFFNYMTWFTFRLKELFLLLFMASFDTFLRTKTLRTSGGRVTFFIMCIMVSDFLHPTRWPLTKIPNISQNILFLS